MATTPVFFRESRVQRSLVGCRLWSRTESDTTEATQQQQQQHSPWGSQSQTRLSSFHIPSSLRGFPGGSEVKASACNVGDPGLIPGGEDPLEKAVATHWSSLAGESHGWRSWLQCTALQRVRHNRVTSLSLEFS